jgi:hypothetical protein
VTSPVLTNALSLVESLSKLLAAVVGVTYLVGFLVVAVYLLQFGVSSFSVLQLQYPIAGMWAVVPPVLFSGVVYAGRGYEDRVAPLLPGKFGWRRLLISSTITAIPLALFFGLVIAIPNFFEKLTWRVVGGIYLFYLAMSVCTFLLWRSWTARAEDESIWLNQTHAARFYLTLLLMIALSYAVWFSVRVYPLIPFSLGGGAPLTVVFIEGERKMPQEIQRPDPGAKRSIPYKLLLSTDRYYIVVSPSPDERSLEISREAVAGIVVLR